MARIASVQDVDTARLEHPVSAHERFEDDWKRWRIVATTMPSESGVEQDLAAPLLKWLGYTQGVDYETQPSLHHVLVVGSGAASKKEVPTRPDFVLGPANRCKVPGECWAVVEVKKPNQNLDAARGQAQYYSDFLKVPYYAVANGVKFRLYQRTLVTSDRCLVEVSLLADTSDAKADMRRLWKILKRDALESRVATLRDREILSVSALMKEVATLHRQDHLVLKTIDGRWFSNQTQQVLCDASAWWGEAALPSTPTAQTVILTQIVSPTSPTGQLLTRIALHGGISCLEMPSTSVELWIDHLKRQAQRIHSRVPNVVPHRSPFSDQGVKLLGPEAELSAQVEAGLDEWVESCVRSVVAQVIEHRDDAVLDSKHRGVWTERDCTNAGLRKVHAQAASQLRVPLLRAMLRQADQSVGRLSQRDNRVMFGPYYAAALSDAWLMILALKAAFKGYGPCNPVDMSLNITSEAEQKPLGLVAALPLLNRVGVPAGIYHDALILGATQMERLLARSRLGRRLADAQHLIGDPLLFSGVVFSLDSRVRDHALEQGWQALIDALKEQARQQLNERKS